MKRVLIVGKSGVGLSQILAQNIREKYGNDVQIYTPKQALKEGLTANDFINTTYEFSRPITTEKDRLAFFTGGKVGKGGRARNRSKNSKINKFHK